MMIHKDALEMAKKGYNPTKSDAWNKGYKAFLGGMEQDANPFQEGLATAEDWFLGWEQAEEHKSQNPE